jgi:hypothetical protein
MLVLACSTLTQSLVTFNLFLQAYGYELPKDIEYIYTNVRKTHNSGVFDAYTDEMKRARKSGILTGLPDGYGEALFAGCCCCCFSFLLPCVFSHHVVLKAMGLALSV